MIKLQQYYAFKLSTSRLKESNFIIDNLTVAEARLSGEIIQIGDNQVFRTIRKINRVETDSSLLESLIRQRDEIKKQKASKVNSSLINEKQRQIDSILFVPDIINVKVDDKKVYKTIFREGFTVNGIKFLRFCSGSGQSRRSIASFVNAEIKEELDRKLNCGLKIKKINVAKYNAYFGLYMSATYEVRTPRVCLINDCEFYKLNKTVDWIEDEQGTNSRAIFEKEIEFVPNMWDGQGLISPEMAKLWQADLDLDYLPSQFGIRSSFIKGMLVTFDFHKFAKSVAEKDTIVDHYGKEWNIQDIDVLLSVSQFKMYKFYQSWSEFEQLQEHHGHSWGITKVNDKVDKYMSTLNYQYIQTLDLDKDKLKELSAPTTEWIEKVCSGDKLQTLLFLLGNCKDSDTIAKIFNRTNSNFVKAILYDDSLLQDPYIKKKIYDSISNKIQDAKIGRLWVSGNYQAMISCPYAQAQWAFGEDVTGLLKEFEHYSSYWNSCNVDRVDACRSPMVDFHEHNVLNFVNSDDTIEWYKYIHSGIIYNVWGVDTIRHSDSDWDFDIVFTTDNQTILDNIYPDQNVITYDKVSAPSQSLNTTNIMKTDLRSFDSRIGSITNYSTTFISMLANFNEGSYEHSQLTKRIKLLRRYIGDSIDQAKGIKMKPFPTEWKRREYIHDEDSEELKQHKYQHNRLVANKKPYFMIYIYDRVKNEYKEYKKKCERTCKEKFACTLNQLISKENKSKQESYYVSDYYRRMPVIKNRSVMNILCGMIESIDFKYKRPKNDDNAEKMFSRLYDYEIGVDNEKLAKLTALYAKFKKKRNFKFKNNILENIDFDAGQDDERKKLINEFYDGIRREAYEICSNQKELANHLVYIVYHLNPSDSKDFAWNIGAEGILETLESKSNKEIEIPMLDERGEEYLGKKYSLRRVVV